MSTTRMLATFDVMGDITVVGSPGAIAKPVPAQRPISTSLPTSPAKYSGIPNGVHNNATNGYYSVASSPIRTSNIESSGIRGPHSDFNLNNNHLKNFNNNNINIMNGKGPIQKVKDHMLTKQQTQTVFPKRPSIDIQFSDITYKVWSLNMHKRKIDRKQILHGVSGEFRSGELTAIMGPSGAGKSTLLNILAGFTLRGSGGTMGFNGRARNDSTAESFKKLSCYIQQDDALRPLLRVHEYMTLAANLKLGYTVQSSSKKHKVREILSMLGLEAHMDTMTGRLSGGQRKRLSIALELLSNPAVIFLDEPTTGLDSSSTTQCVSLLKSLARDGRTIICTIHQPSALIFEMFDQLYGVAAGHCVYQGGAKGLLPHLANLGLNCPPYHNPADFLMEVSSGEYDVPIEKLAEAATKNSTAPIISETGPLLVTRDDSQCKPHPAPLMIQFLLLYMRNIAIMRRDLSSLTLRLFMHVFIGLVFGYLYRGVGNSADDALANVVYLYGSNLFLVYTGQMAVTLAFPLEVEILTREHFNRWYKLGPYLLASLLVELPLQAVLCATYIAPSYLLTEQPLEIIRIVNFYTLATLGSLTAQSCGFLFGATTPITISVFLGPVVAVLLSIFGFCIWYKDIPIVFRWIYHISYFRAAFQGALFSMYSYGRDNLPCRNEELSYCHYSPPKKVLDEMDVADINFWNNSASIVLFCVIVYICTALVIWFRLNKR